MPPRKPSPIGAHVPATGGLTRGVLPYARQVGAEAVQVFVSNPRVWPPTEGAPAHDMTFRDGCGEHKIAVYIHAPYLINFGSPTTATLEKSVEATRLALARGRRIGARGVVVHAGSAVTAAHRGSAFRQVRERVLPILDELTDDHPRLLVEPTAGGGYPLAARVSDLAEYLSVLDGHPRLGVCVDTCHLHAAGHDLAPPGGMRSALSKLAKTVGRGRLRLVHANDSKDPVGSGRDRHQTIGDGTIGTDPFVELFRHPVTRDVPVVIETPGEAAEHIRDIGRLKALRDKV